MDSLENHIINNKYVNLFLDDEYNNTIRFIYTAILSATRARADQLIISLNGMEWYKNTDLIGTFLGGDIPSPIPSYKENIHKILLRNLLIKNTILIEYETDTKVVIRIIYHI